MNTEAEKKSLNFNILIKEEKDYYIAHCLELDIVATGHNKETVQNEIVDLIKAQVGYAFANNNLDYLYHPAPPEVWKEYFECKESWERNIETEANHTNGLIESFVPPWIIAKMCQSLTACHA